MHGYLQKKGSHIVTSETTLPSKRSQIASFVWRKNRINTAISVRVLVARVTSDSLGYKAALVWGKEKRGPSSKTQQIYA